MADQIAPTQTATETPGRGAELNDKDVLACVNAFYAEAESSKRWRLSRNADNRDAFLGQQDWSDKIPGQSKEFLPKTGVAVEQFAAFFKRALTQAGPDWFEIIPPRNSPLTGKQCKDLMALFLDDCLLEDGVRGSVHTAISDVARLGAVESLCILKVHGNTIHERRFQAGQPVEGAIWKLRVDVVPFESYFPDPTGKGLYEIHEIECDLWEVEARAREGLYDIEEVAKLRESVRLEQSGARKAHGVAQSESSPPGLRKKVVLRELWGTILDKDGHAVMHNAVCTVANGKHVIRKPQPNPFWHGLSPFVCAPIIRVPKSVHHKALFDEAAQLNFAMNELYNLFIDGAISSVWGIRQLREDFLEDPRQVADGIPQGETLVVNSNLPQGEKVLEIVASGQVPQDAMAIFEALNREFTQAALSNELQMGQLPGRAVKATEVVEVSKNTNAVMDGIAGDLERTLMEPLLKRVFLLIMQFIDGVPVLDLADAIGAQGTMMLSSIPPEERFSIFQGVNLKVRGLSAVLERVRNFQKMTALLQVVTTNPIFLQAFFMKYSPDALLAYMMKTLQLDPNDFERAGREQFVSVQQDMQNLPMFQQMANPKGEGSGAPQNMGGNGAGGDSFVADVNQNVNPMTGFTGNA